MPTVDPSGRRRRLGAGALAPAERRRLADIVHDAIRESIITGRLEMGERLVETRLAADLQVSRAPIREALMRLGEEGLVVERPHRGVFVRRLDANGLIALYNARLGIEPVALRLFMRAEQPAQPLRDHIDAIQAAAHAGDAFTVARAELGFHRHIVEGAGNDVLRSIFNALEGQLLMALALDDSSFEQLSGVADEHVPVVEAIETGDEDQAVRVFEQHIVSTIGPTLERLGGDPGLLVVRAAAR
jgi:DNA-binding GntR family transcriptional regulator